MSSERSSFRLLVIVLVVSVLVVMLGGLLSGSGYIPARPRPAYKRPLVRKPVPVVANPVQTAPRVAAPPAPQPSPVPSPEEESLRASTEYIERLVRKGALTDLNVQAGFARINPAVWLSLDYQSKRYLVYTLSEYCQSKRGPNQVEMRSDRNDQVFGKGSHKWGIKILE